MQIRENSENIIVESSKKDIAINLALPFVT
jgi:hypothetical protein